MDNHYTAYSITDRSFIAYTKRDIRQRAGKARFTETQLAEIDLIISEMCTNLIKHANGGELWARIMSNSDEVDVLELLCLDNGPGFDDTAKAMRDGFSTKQTLGHGLGSISRLSDVFQIMSRPGWGTVVYCNKSSSPLSVEPGKRKIDVKAVCVPKTGESLCGDGYQIKKQGAKVQMFFGDGLGHGQPAHQVVQDAIAIFNETEEFDAAEMIKIIHNKLRKSRGLVCTVASLDCRENMWSICGVGNIMTRIYSGITFKGCMAYNGVVGLNIPRVLANSTYCAERNQRLVMCSDGIRSGWEISKVPGILRYDNALIAAYIHKDYSRKTDDTSVLVATLN